MRVWLVAVLSVSAMHGETLNYTIGYASGLSVGDASLQSNAAGTGWKFAMDLDISLPGFPLRDHYTSTADAKFCTEKLEKAVVRGTKKSEETVTFDQAKQRVTRKTKGGGESEMNTPACAHDPMAFLQFVRKELAQGRLAPQQSVILGGAYQVRFEYAGVQHVTVGKQKLDTERIQTTIKGPASDITVELFFLQDAARTPVMAKIPTPLGAFVVELER